MPDTPRIVLLTGNERRHRYVAAQFARSLRLVGVVYEQKRPVLPEPTQAPADDITDIARHLAERDAAELRLLGDSACLPDVASLAVEVGGTNAPATFNWITQQRPDLLVVYGTSLIKPPLLTDYAGRMVNIHLGLSPYYRGSGTNFWPLVYRQPECVGATLHILDAHVDTGPILHQVRPDAIEGDRAHELGTKTIQAAAASMPRVIERVATCQARPHQQNLTLGRVFRRKDFNAQAVRTMWQQFETGMLEEYLSHRADRCAAVPIVELN